MGSGLGPTMPGIFVDFHDVDLFSNYEAPEVYFRYVDDTFEYLEVSLRLTFFFLTFK